MSNQGGRGSDRLLVEHPNRHVVLVGHGTAWTLAAAALTGVAPDLDGWRSSSMPDVIEVPRSIG